MKKVLIAALLLAPSITLAGPIDAEYFVATSSTATSTFAGNVEIEERVEFGLGARLLSIFDAAISALNAISPDTTTDTEAGYLIAQGGQVGIAATPDVGDAGRLTLTGGSVGSSGHILGGEGNLWGGSISVEDEANYELLIGGDVRIGGGQVASMNGTGSGGMIITYGGAGESNGVFAGGNVEIRPGQGEDGGEDGSFRIFNPDNSKFVAFDLIDLIDDSIVAFPALTGGTFTFGLLERAQTWTGANIFSFGASATTTVTFGKLGDMTSKTCFNAKDADGNDVSFYIAGGAMVVENNVCN